MNCAYCVNTGWVVYATRPEGQEHVDQMAPCPICDAGRLIEFPPPDEKGKPQTGPWGTEGFWKGRDHSHILPFDTGGPVVPPPPEFRAIFEKLMAA